MSDEIRRLAAIMFTDIVGYSAKVQKNEQLALELLIEHNDLLRPIFNSFQGHEIKTIGDSFLVEFSNVLDATKCAVECQKIFYERNKDADADRQIEIRIGIHVGDVVYRENDIFGDGVNIAARIQPLAEPGGICVSEDVARQIQNKIEMPVMSMGKGELKNIKLAVAIYRVVLPWKQKKLPLSKRLKHVTRLKTVRYSVIGFTAVIILLIFAIRGGYLKISAGKQIQLNPEMIFKEMNVPVSTIEYSTLTNDGKWIVFSAADKNNIWGLYVLNISTDVSNRITWDSNAVTIESIDVSQDGSRIIYGVITKVNYLLETRMVSFNGGNTIKLEKLESAARWHPSGNEIGFFKTSMKSNKQISEFYTYQTETGDLKLIFLDSSTYGKIPDWYSNLFSWSPDGKYIVFPRMYAGYCELFIHNIHTQAEEQITFDSVFSRDPYWTANGEIIYVSNKCGSENLWIIPSAGGTAVQITKGISNDYASCLSKDRKMFHYLQRKGFQNIFYSTIVRPEPKRVNIDDGIHYLPQFTPKFGMITFLGLEYVSDKYYPHIYTMNLDGSDRKAFTSGNELNFKSIWSPDGNFFAYESWKWNEGRKFRKVWVIDTKTTSKKILIDQGSPVHWLNNDQLIILKNFRSYLVSINENIKIPIYEDSTEVIPILSNKYILFYDYHSNRAGWYIIKTPPGKLGEGVLFNINKKPKALKIDRDTYFCLKNNGRSLYYINEDELWTIHLPQLKYELVSKIPNMNIRSFLSFDVSNDQKNILYNTYNPSSKIILINNFMK